MRALAWGRRLLSTLGAGMVVVCAGVVPSAHASMLQIDVGSLDHPAFTIEGMHLAVGEERAPAQLTIDRLVIGTDEWTNIALDCSEFRLADGALDCAVGQMRAPGFPEGVALALRFDPTRKSATLKVGSVGQDLIEIDLAPDGRLHAKFSAIAAERLAEWVPALDAWQLGGRFSGVLAYSPGPAATLSVHGSVDDARFSSRDGFKAAENLALALALDASTSPSGWDWDATAQWEAGEAYFHPLYLTSGAALTAHGTLAGALLDVHRAALALEGMSSVEGRGTFDLSAGALRDAALSITAADLEVLGPQFVAPLLAPAQPQALRFSGQVSAGATIGEGRLTGVDLALDAVSVASQDGGFAVGPLSGALPWRRDGDVQARLAVAGGNWHALTFGAFDLDARVRSESVDIDRVEVPLLDGRLVLNALALHRSAQGWEGTGAAVVEPVSMTLLTEALGLPSMAGVLSASIPGVRASPGEIALDGTMVISVFNGYLQAGNLQIIEPFGSASRVFADLSVRGLDLAELTETFSFGSVSGFIDADVQALELAHWTPVRFDAAIRSSPGSYPRRISQRAVQNIGALGGPGAAMVIQRGFLGLFETFGYREIGLTCKLEGGVCVMGGVDDDAGSESFTIIRGGGIPALNVIGYNRRVDWEEFVARVRRVVESNVAPVIE